MKKIIITSILFLAIVHISSASFETPDYDNLFATPRYDIEIYGSQFDDGLDKEYDSNISAWDFADSYSGSGSDIILRADGDWVWGDGDDQKTGAPISDGLYLLLFFSLLYIARCFLVKTSIGK